MFGIVVISHGSFAEELVQATSKIVGELEGFEAVSIGWDDAVDDARERIRQAIERVGDGRGVLVLTDMFGGTPSNLALSFLEAGRIEIVTGVNLPMLIKSTNLREEVVVADAATRVAGEGRESIQVASQILEQRSAAEHEEQG